MYQKFGKRCFDIVLSLIGIIILSPILLIVALLVRIKLGSPILFIQERPGYKEKIFRMYKFRSMNDARDCNGNLLSDDIRLTSFGKKLRSTSLDELPELFNILKGDMSIVGPRPLLVQYLPYYTETEQQRHDVLPGLSGWAQINGRNFIEWKKRLALDVFYVENYCFSMDFKIMLKTISQVVKKKNVSSLSSESETNLAEERMEDSNNREVASS